MRIDLDETEVTLLTELASQVRSLREISKANLREVSEYVFRIDRLQDVFTQRLIDKVWPEGPKEQGEFVFGPGD